MDDVKESTVDQAGFVSVLPSFLFCLPLLCQADPLERAAEQWREVTSAADDGDEAAAHLQFFVIKRHSAASAPWCDLPIDLFASLLKKIPAEVFFDEDPPENVPDWTEKAMRREREAGADVAAADDFRHEKCADDVARKNDHMDEEAEMHHTSTAPQVLFDRVNPVAVKEIGRRVLSKVFRTAGGMGPTLLRVAGDILKQCGRGTVSGARCFYTTYREEKNMVKLGMKERRYSGFCPVVKKKKKDEAEDEAAPEPDGGLVTAHVRTGELAEGRVSARLAEPLRLRLGECSPGDLCKEVGRGGQVSAEGVHRPPRYRAGGDPRGTVGGETALPPLAVRRLREGLEVRARRRAVPAGGVRPQVYEGDGGRAEEGLRLSQGGPQQAPEDAVEAC